MSNSRSFRRKITAGPAARRAGGNPGRPWNKGLAMTADPSDSTTRRWLNAAEDAGLLQRSGTRRTGKPGRPAQLREITGEGRALAGRLPPQAVVAERLRRQANARKRGARPGRGRVTQAEAISAAGMMLTATGKLIAAGGDASALAPDEAGALVRFGCAAWKDGVLTLRPEWLEAYGQVPASGGAEAG